MARARSPNRDKAFELWKKSNGSAKLKDIAQELGCSDSQVRKWKNQDDWDGKMKGNVTNDKSNVTQKRKPGAPKNNKNAIGNSGGAAPKRNSNAVTHGFFKTIFPDDEETFQIIEEIQQKSPIDIIWENIVIKYTAIARAQKLMFVKDQDDITQVLKKEKVYKEKEQVVTEDGSVSDEMVEVSGEREWEFQLAWDKHATFLNAQSRAMSELRALVKDFLQLSGQDDLRRLQLEKMQKEIAKIDGDAKQSEGTGVWVDAIKAAAEKRKKRREGDKK